jgi:methionyl-tRNA formyltransferase
VLVNGEKETGVSLHTMVAMADAGDLVDQERVPIALEETALTLYGKLEAAAATLLDRALPALRDGIAHLRPMNLEEGSYFGGRTPEDGRFEWNWSAERIYNLVRAVTHPYPGAFTAWRDKKLLVWWALPIRSFPAAPSGTVLAVDLDGVTVAAGAGAGAVRLVTVQLDGQPELPACSFALGAGIAPGARLGDPRPSSDPGTRTPDPASSRKHGNGETP